MGERVACRLKQYNGLWGLYPVNSLEFTVIPHVHADISFLYVAKRGGRFK
ncbi:MAG: hypothetical protein K0R28_4302 [Paenibacillus sp.]|jgi:hypothetical protein|nr:hypothetical protein [Paenibacillus sp.]